MSDSVCDYVAWADATTSDEVLRAQGRVHPVECRCAAGDDTEEAGQPEHARERYTVEAATGNVEAVML